MNGIIGSEFSRNTIISKIEDIENQLIEEEEKEDGERDRQREFELMYARFMAGLKLSTGYTRMF